MRQRLRLLALPLAIAMVCAMFIGGCEAITNAAKLKIPITVSIHPKSDNPVIPFVDEDCADLSTNKDYLDNKDQFEGATVKELKVLIDQLVNPVFTSGTLADQKFTYVRVYLVFDPIYNDPQVYEIGGLTDVSLAGMYGPAGGTALVIPKSSGADEAVKLILQRPKFCVRVDYGAMNTGPASATHIEGTVDLTLNFEASAI